MKRDMDLAREILLKVEEHPGLSGLTSSELKIEGYSEETIYYHIRLLYEANLIEAHFSKEIGQGAGLYFRVKGLTWG